MTDSVAAAPDGVTDKLSSRSVPATVERLKEILTSHGLTTFAVIDQQAAAQRVGQDLRETVLVLFGSPSAGTPVMDAFPYAALDLPLKVLIWWDGSQTRVSYLSPGALAARYQLTPELADNLGTIDGLTEHLVAP